MFLASLCVCVSPQELGNLWRLYMKFGFQLCWADHRERSTIQAEWLDALGLKIHVLPLTLFQYLGQQLDIQILARDGPRLIANKPLLLQSIALFLKLQFPGSTRKVLFLNMLRCVILTSVCRHVRWVVYLASSWAPLQCQLPRIHLEAKIGILIYLLLVKQAMLAGKLWSGSDPNLRCCVLASNWDCFSYSETREVQCNFNDISMYILSMMWFTILSGSFQVTILLIGPWKKQNGIQYSLNLY